MSWAIAILTFICICLAVKLRYASCERDEAIKSKDAIVREKEEIIKEKEVNIKSKDAIVREKEEIIKEKEVNIKKVEAISLKQSKTISDLEKKNNALIIEYDLRKDALQKLRVSNLKAIPFYAGIMADYLTYDYEELAKKLDWGKDFERAKKVTSIRKIRDDAHNQIEQAKEAQYKLEYAFALFPSLHDIIDDEFELLPPNLTDIPEYDRAKDFLSVEEYQTLTQAQKNQLALDRYIASHKKTKWQIGRDYELSIAYQFRKKGYTVNTFGSYMGLEDLGRDLIATRGNTTLIIQCKYWSQSKTIHEKHIAQLYGTTVCYQLEEAKLGEEVKGVFVTNIFLSDIAKRFAKHLDIIIYEGEECDEYPRIKCNINRDKYGFTEKIYHLPFDQQYDNTKIDKPGELYAFTIKEAEKAGFRRAHKWYGD